MRRYAAQELEQKWQTVLKIKRKESDVKIRCTSKVFKGKIPVKTMHTYRFASHWLLLCEKFPPDTSILWYKPRETESRHTANLAVTIGIGGYHYDNLPCHWWRWSLASWRRSFTGNIIMVWEVVQTNVWHYHAFGWYSCNKIFVYISESE